MGMTRGGTMVGATIATIVMAAAIGGSAECKWNAVRAAVPTRATRAGTTDARATRRRQSAGDERRVHGQHGLSRHLA